VVGLTLVAALVSIAAPDTGTAARSVESLLQSASAHYRAGRLEAAIGDLESAIALEPSNPQARFMLANARLRGGEYRRAAEEYRATLGLEPEQSDAQLNLGFALHRLGDTTSAVEAWRRAVERARRDPLARVALALGELRNGDEDAALLHYSIAIVLEPETETRDYYRRDFRWRPQDVDALEGLSRRLAAERTESPR